MRSRQPSSSRARASRRRSSICARIRPLDTATIVESVKRTNRLVSVEEGWPFAGIGSELAAVMMEQAFDWLDAPVMRVAGADVPLPYAANLERLALPHPEQIVAAARQACYRA